MKNYIYIFLAIIPFLLTSCDEEMHIDLNVSEPRLVIDASLAAQDHCKVKLTMTQDYWDTDAPKGITGAVITISDKLGNKEELTDSDSNGNYISKMFGAVDNTYTLRVEVDGEVYEATEYLPPVVPIEAIGTHAIDTGDELHFFPKIVVSDPKGIENFYFVNITINNNRMQGLRHENDKYFDGVQHKEFLLFFDKKENDDEELKVGDKVVVELQSIGKGAYTYFSTIESPGGSPNSNPTSNFSGDVLGMFKTYSSASIEMTITEEDLQ